MHEISTTSPLKMPKISQNIKKLLLGIFGQTLYLVSPRIQPPLVEGARGGCIRRLVSGRLPDNTEELA